MASSLVDEAVIYAPGEMVPWHFTPSIIVASFFASLSGTLLTIELLQRKRLGKSLVSRWISLSPAICYTANLDTEYTSLLVR